MHAISGRLHRVTPLHLDVWLALLMLIWASATSAESPAPTQPIAKYEVRFMEEMIEHHAMAMHMAMLCMDKAVHPELREMCEQIHASQREEVSMMRDWLSGWYGIRFTPQMSPGAMKQMEKLAELSGADFEIAFMRQMIRHHRLAINRAASCTERAYHPELIDMCEAIVETQAAEVTQLRSWLCEWYGLCDRRKIRE